MKRPFHPPFHRRYFPSSLVPLSLSHRIADHPQNTHRRHSPHEIQLLLALPSSHEILFPENTFASLSFPSHSLFLFHALSLSLSLVHTCTHMCTAEGVAYAWLKESASLKKGSRVLSREDPFYEQILMDVETKLLAGWRKLQRETRWRIRNKKRREKKRKGKKKKTVAHRKSPKARIERVLYFIVIDMSP